MLLHIFMTTVAPILVMVYIGYFMDHRFKIDLDTLSKLNFYLLSPAFLFTNLYTSHIGGESLAILWVYLLIIFLTGIASLFMERAFKYEPSKRGVFRNAQIFNNCGNIGIPLVTFIYTNAPYVDAQGQAVFLPLAMAAQIVVFVAQNVLTNSFGFYFAGEGKLMPRDALLLVLRMPLIYSVIAGFLCSYWEINLESTIIWPVIKVFSDALVSIALFTLGVQLGRTSLYFFNKDVIVGTVGRLFVGPLLAIWGIWLYEVLFTPFSPTVKQVLFIGAAVPSGVNTALIAAALHNHAEFATQLVVATTILSSVTLPFIIWLAAFLY